MSSDASVLKEVAALSPAELKMFVWNLGVVKQNALIGVDALEPHHATLKAIYTHYTPAGVKLLSLIDVLAQAHQRVKRARPSAKGIQALSTPVFADREQLIAQLTVWGLTGLVPMAEVNRIKAGTGKIDAAEDVLAIADLVERQPEVKAAFVGSGKSLEEKVGRAKALLDVLKPIGTNERPNHELEEALDFEARVWVLVQRQHEALWKDAARIFGRRVDDKVPSLTVRSSTRRAPKAEPAPATPAS
jgi:hypothetical protein